MEDLDTQPSNKRRNIIIGVVAAVIIVAVIIITSRGLTPASEGSQQSVLQTLQTDVSGLQTWKAETAETISNIQTDIGQIEALSYSADIDALYLQLEAVKADILGLSYQTVEVTRIEGEYLDITAYQEGSYPIILNLYGVDLTNVEARFPTVYTVAGLWGGNSTMSAVVEGTWTAGYVVELKITGTTQYACAIIGASEGVSEEVW